MLFPYLSPNRLLPKLSPSGSNFAIWQPWKIPTGSILLSGSPWKMKLVSAVFRDHRAKMPASARCEITQPRFGGRAQFSRFRAPFLFRQTMRLNISFREGHVGNGLTYNSRQREIRVHSIQHSDMHITITANIEKGRSRPT